MVPTSRVEMALPALITLGLNEGLNERDAPWKFIRRSVYCDTQSHKMLSNMAHLRKVSPLRFSGPRLWASTVVSASDIVGVMPGDQFQVPSLLRFSKIWFSRVFWAFSPTVGCGAILHPLLSSFRLQSSFSSSAKIASCDSLRIRLFGILPWRTLPENIGIFTFE